ncbi:Na+-translocating ferredoxin:NAD+ oxidoreductase RNF, RnfC subunit [Desulfacinum hydrothermale DSM 13146]|uniref:Na+-translocating ferredoxin:NAD+ oxidoreductase RNF, RnfC subunit n=1 Tax=Desulfacinum hydrothermale DSM 13146 TaxID=1121390 RepID=A0A1W1XEV5_9BACT|nr:4Fe-4S dicluster domain-containing protein [Desulfacinum hydrothermale]SMC22051.1 Na+-translocating ferredoxin:NAD+ oxidoreductase RNF, RnfC subunit [Desulfacinum hydrothermale DSM 13146]
MNKSQLLEWVRTAGIVGQGGAGFPAHVKYDVEVETVIANGCECEPLLHSDKHLMEARAQDLVRGLSVLKAATGARRAVIAIKGKYVRVAACLQQAVAGTDLELAFLDDFYPAGDEQILIYEVTGRSVPPLGLPKDVGALVANVGTLVSVADALNGKPVTHRLVTVTGEVARPAIWNVPLGTSLADLVQACGGASVEDPVYILGGPMMGRVVDDPRQAASTVITKTIGGVILIPRGHYLHQRASLSLEVMVRRAATACIQCRYCTDLCPRFLIGHDFQTHKVMRALGGGGPEAMPGSLQALLCSECGLCELFSCPMHLSPRRLNAALKARFRENRVGFPEPRQVKRSQASLRGYRKIPVSRLAIKLDIARYMDLHPKFLGDVKPAQVRVLLHQHIGAPAVAMVKPGDRVTAGQPVGAVPQGALGACVHAPISGVVAAVDDAVTITGEAS